MDLFVMLWNVMVVLPVVVVFSIICALRARYGRRVATLVACAIAGTLVVLFTESLSALHAIARGPLLLAWGLAAVASLSWAIRSRQVERQDDLAVWFAPENRILWTALAFVLLITLTTALLAAPNTVDSLTYHMARVAHWEQNRSVAPYPTPNLRQLHLGPFTEYAILHLQVLTGTDVYANLVQWAAVLGVALAVSLIAGQLGAGHRGQLLAALVAISTPMAVAQASSTQTDAVAALWLIAFVALAAEGFGLEPRRTSRERLLELAVLGGCLGLAGLTKATAYVFGFPIVVWFVATRLKAGRMALVRALSFVFGVALALNLAFFVRNIRLEGSPLGSGSEGEYRYTNESHGARAITSNVVRNVALHFGTPSHAVNVHIDSLITRSLRRLSIDPNDPRTTWIGTSFSVGFCANDGCAENPVQLFLAIVCFAVVLFRRRPLGIIRERDIALCVIGGFVLFCALLKWQPWHSRLQLPLFLLAAPVIAAVLDRRLGNRALGAVIVMMLITVVSLPLLEPLRPFVGKESVFRVSRQESYLAMDPTRIPPLRRVVQGIADSHCDQVGLITSGDAIEYTLWAFARNRLSPMPRIQHVAVTNVSASLATKEPFRGFVPCAVVTFDNVRGPALRVGGTTFVRTDSVATNPQLYLPAATTLFHPPTTPAMPP